MDFFHGTGNREYNIKGGSNITFDVSSGNASLTVDMQDKSRILAPIVLNDDLDYLNSNNQNFRIQGNISGTGGITVQGGRLTFENGNVSSYTGDTVVEDGQLHLKRSSFDGGIGGDLTIGDGNGAAGSAIVDYANRNNQISNTTAITILSDGLLDLTNENDTVGSISSSSTAAQVMLGGAAAGILTVGDATNATFDGTITERGDIVKQGDGTWTLTNNNSYDGTTTINNGVLEIEDAGALGDTNKDTTVNSGGTLALDTGITTVVGEGLTLNGTGEAGTAGALQNIGGTNEWQGTVDLGSAATINSDAGSLEISGNIDNQTFDLTVGGAADTTFSGVLSDTGDLIKNGNGTLTLTAANTYSGNTTVNDGVLEIENGSALGTTGSGTTVNSGGTLALDTGIIVGAEALTLNGTGESSAGALQNISGSNEWQGTVSLGSAATINSDAGSLDVSGNIDNQTFDLTVGGNGDTTFSGIVSETGNLVKDGNGTLTLSGVNTYSGSTTINGGSISISADSGLGTAPGAATPGHLTFDGGTLNTTATFTLNSNRGIALNAGGGTIETDPATTLTYGGIIAGAGNLDKTGTGTLVLSGVNTHTGTTTVQTGILEVTNANALGGTGTGTVVQSGATLEVSNIAANMAAEPLTINGTGVGGVGALYWTDTGFDAWTGDITLGSNSTITNTAAGIMPFSGDIDLNGSTLTVDNAGLARMIGTSVISGMGNFVKDGASTWFMIGGTNTYTGSTTVNNGILNMNVAGGTSVPGDLIIGDGVGAAGTAIAFVGSNEQIANTSDVTIDADGRLDVNSFSETIASLTSGSATAEVFLGSGTLTVGDATSTTFAGVISEAGDIVKNGTGTLTLTGTNSFTGDATVNAGTLELNNGSGNALDGIANIVINGGSLLLSGDNQIVDTANMDLAGGTFDADGNDEVLGTLTLSSDSSIDLGTTSSILDFADSSGLELAWTTSGQLLSILDYTGDTNGGGIDQIIFNSQGLTDSQLAAIRFVNPWGSGLTIGARWQGNEIVPVPEPSTYLGAGLILTLIGWRERRRLQTLIGKFRQAA
jgi:fibronectin-binding autotransporter adhesin